MVHDAKASCTGLDLMSHGGFSPHQLEPLLEELEVHHDLNKFNVKMTNVRKLVTAWSSKGSSLSKSSSRSEKDPFLVHASCIMQKINHQPIYIL